MTPFITVVIPVRNEAKFIKETLLQLVMQDYPKDRYELLVVDGMSQDETRSLVMELANSYSQIILLDNPKRLSSAGRNIGFKNGLGDYFLVVDGHCYLPDDQLFKSIVECFRNSGADCLGRPQTLDPPGLTVFQQAIALARSSKIGHGGDSLIYDSFEGYASPVSNGAVYSRKIFEVIGYVDETFDACEDVEFNYRIERAGLKCYTSPRLTVRYYPRENLQTLFRQLQRYGVGRRKFTQKHLEALTINQLIPAGFTLGLILLSLTGFLTFLTSLFNAVFSVMAGIYALYAILIVFESIRLANQKGWQYFLNLPLIFITIHLSLGWGFIRVR